MGAVWSQNARVENQPEAQAPSALRQTRKRKATGSLQRDTPFEGETTEQQNGSNNVPKKEVQKEPTENKQVDANQHPTSKFSDLDTTPDGESHRYTVTCSTIYWLNRKETAKLLGKLHNLPPFTGLQKISRWDHFSIAFPNAKCAERGVEILSAQSYRSEPWEVCFKPVEPLTKRTRVNANSASAPPPDCPTAASVTAKWRDVAYDIQVNRKRSKLRDALCAVTKNMRKEVRDTKTVPWLDELLSDCTSKRVPNCCEFVDILTAEEHINARNHYRNKNEFTIGMSPDACGLKHDYHVSQLTIGYSIGYMREGKTFVGPLDDSCLTTSKLAIRIANILTLAIAPLGLPAYDKHSHEGYWRQVTIRETARSGNFMVVMAVNTVPKDATAEEVDAWNVSDKRCRQVVEKALRDTFDEESCQFGIFWYACGNISTVTYDTPLTHLYGIEVLHEEMCGLTFRLQPTAFFQVNTVMAEHLYNLIADLANVDKDTTVLDLCCGTGTIGLSLAARAHSVVGIELNESAVADATFNASLNKIHNALFLAGKVEDKIQNAIKQLDGTRKCVVILDPPRAGLPNSVISAVRAMPAVQHVVYVSCDPKNFYRNAVALCRPTSKSYRLQPFRPIKAYGVDLFPHTDHSEMVTLLTREINK